MNDTPPTPAKMVDKLHTLFGIGEADDIAPSKPFHHDRMVQIAKLKAMLKSRRASLAEINIAADYAHASGKPIHEVWQVFALIPEAMKARFQDAARTRREASASEIEDAIAEAVEHGEHRWADRLMRAEDKTAALHDWRSR